MTKFRNILKFFYQPHLTGQEKIQIDATQATNFDSLAKVPEFYETYARVGDMEVPALIDDPSMVGDEFTGTPKKALQYDIHGNVIMKPLSANVYGKQYIDNNFSNINNTLKEKAPLISPVFSGTPKLPEATTIGGKTISTYLVEKANKNSAVFTGNRPTYNDIQLALSSEIKTFTLTEATANALGGIKVGYNSTDSSKAAVKLENSKAYVEIPKATKNSAGIIKLPGDVDKNYPTVSLGGTSDNPTVSLKALTYTYNQLSTSERSIVPGQTLSIGYQEEVKNYVYPVFVPYPTTNGVKHFQDSYIWLERQKGGTANVDLLFDCAGSQYINKISTGFPGGSHITYDVSPWPQNLQNGDPTKPPTNMAGDLIIDSGQFITGRNHSSFINITKTSQYSLLIHIHYISDTHIHIQIIPQNQKNIDMEENSLIIPFKS